MLSPEVIKVCLLFTLLFATFTFSMLPVKMMSVAKRQNDRRKRKRLNNIISLLSCYSAGIFLATCLLDLFPEVQIKMTQSLDSFDISSTYPIGEFILAFGLFLIFIMEQIVLTCKEKGNDDSYEPLLASTSSVSSVRHNIPGRENRPGPRTYISDNVSVNRYEHANAENELSQDDCDVIMSDEDAEVFNELTESEIYQDPSSHSVIRSVMLLLTLSMHSVFEGLAIGLQGTTRDVLSIFAPVALHKSILAFSLGVNLVQSEMKPWGIIRSNIIFAITAPVGIGIGILIVDISPDSIVTTLIDGILQGIACGTFLYIVFFEILPHEFMTYRRYPSRLLKTLMLLFGFATVAVLLFFQPEDITLKCVWRKV